MQYTISQIENVAQELIRDVFPLSAPVILFQGEMGAGKTTLIRAICQELGVKDPITSPTFSLVNEYRDALGRKLFHFDLYRIEEEQEALDFGIEEYWEEAHWCFVEWAERIPSLLPEHYTVISLSTLDDTTRELSIIQHIE